MASSEEIFRAVSTSFINTLRETELGEHYRGPELLFWMNQKFGEIYADGIVNLEPIYLEMQNNKEIEKSDLMGFMLLFREQGEKVGIQVQLPSELLLTKALRKEKLLKRIQRQVDQRRTSPAAEAQAAATAALGGKPVKSGKVVFSSGKSSKLRVALAALAIALAAASIVINIFYRTPPPRELNEVTEIDLSQTGLSGRLERKATVFMLTMAKEEWDVIPKALQRSRVLGLVRLLEPLGFSSLIIVDRDFITLAVAGATNVSFIPYLERAAPGEESGEAPSAEGASDQEATPDEAEGS